MKTAAALKGVTKRYGRHTALDNLSFSIPAGAICGLIGPNGSGKTTTMGILAGLLRPQSGQVKILNSGAFSVSRHAGRVGLMPQDSVPSPYAPIVRSLQYFAELQGLSGKDALTEAERCLAAVHLENKASSKYGALSHGMRRRFSVAQALLGSPELLLLDEPTSGLDPELVVEIRNLIVATRGKSTVLVSSHILSELESMCDHAIFLQDGKCVRQGPMGTITGQDSRVAVRVDRKPDLRALRSAVPGLKFAYDDDELIVTVPPDTPVTEANALCLRWLLDSGVGVHEVSTGGSLESAYLESRQKDDESR